MDRIIIYGGTGLVGSALAFKLRDKYSVTIVTRDVAKAQKNMPNQYNFISIFDEKKIILEIEKSYGIVNLSGKNIGNKRWRKPIKKEIINSRVSTGKDLVNLIEQVKNKPKVFIQASAIGYYPNSYNNIFVEKDINSNNSFLHSVVKNWEASSQNVKKYGIRWISIRMGVILDKNQGAFHKILKPYKLGIGGTIGNGKNWFSWIHIEDVVEAIQYLLKNEKCKDVFNLTSPFSVQYKDVGKTIHNVTGLPNFFTVPAFILKILYGKMAEETILSSQNVFPEKLLNSGFRFKFPKIKEAITDIIYKK